MKYEITGVNGGETNVYVTSQDGSIKSELIHVIVPEPILVESIELAPDKTDLVIGQSSKTSMTLAPSDAENKTLTWSSSDENVVTVDESGTVTAISGGTATITAKTSTNIESSFDVNVDGSKTLMNLSVKHPRDDDVNIGDEWNYLTQINDENISKEFGVAAGEMLTFSARFSEEDDNPDVGTAETTYTVTEDDIANGFSVSMDMYVTENGGRNSGQSAHFIITYTFSPIE